MCRSGSQTASITIKPPAENWASPRQDSCNGTATCSRSREAMPLRACVRTIDAATENSALSNCDRAAFRKKDGEYAARPCAEGPNHAKFAPALQHVQAD